MRDCRLPLTTRDVTATDDELMQRMQTGDRLAFAMLYRRHRVRSNRVAGAVCGNRDRVEEAVQEGFLEIWRDRGSYRQQDTGGVRSWAMAIVRNRAIDLARHHRTGDHLRAREAADGASTQASACSLETDQIARDEGATLRAAVALLPPAQARVIVLSFYGGLTLAEIAARLELPTSTIKGRMRLGLEKLRLPPDPSPDPETRK